MWRKSLVLLALLASTGATEFAPLLQGAAVAATQCTDQFCLCRTHCPPKRQPTPSCHGQADSAQLPQLAAACHYGDVTAPAPAPPRVLPATSSLLPPWRAHSLRIAPATTAAPGFLRHELRPPRLLA